jgi:hypothetical protein
MEVLIDKVEKVSATNKIQVLGQNLTVTLGFNYRPRY